jgi:hypothetical protein
MAVGGMHGSERHAWQWEAYMAVGGMHGSGRHAWQWETCMAAGDMHGSGRYTAVGGIRQWEVRVRRGT